MLTRLAIALALAAASTAAAQPVNPPAAIAEVLKIERVFHLADGRKVTVEESLDPPDRPDRATDRPRAEAVPPPEARRPAPRPAPAPMTTGAGVVIVPPSQPVRRAAPAPIREVSAGTFPARRPADQSGIPYHDGHTCPMCGYTSPDGQGTWIKRGNLAGGEHVHQCPRCAAAWRHRDV